MYARRETKKYAGKGAKGKEAEKRTGAMLNHVVEPVVAEESTQEFVYEDDEDIGDDCNPDIPIQERVLWYDWLADSATTSHVTNMRDAFISFKPINTLVNGVGNAKTYAKGRGTVEVESKVDR